MCIISQLFVLGYGVVSTDYILHGIYILTNELTCMCVVELVCLLCFHRGISYGYLQETATSAFTEVKFLSSVDTILLN